MPPTVRVAAWCAPASFECFRGTLDDAIESFEHGATHMTGCFGSAIFELDLAFPVQFSQLELGGYANVHVSVSTEKLIK